MGRCLAALPAWGPLRDHPPGSNCHFALTCTWTSGLSRKHEGLLPTLVYATEAAAIP